MSLMQLSTLLVPMADGGAGDFFRGPDFNTVAFAANPARWIVGLLLAVAVIAAVVYMVILLLKLPGADRHKARGIGEQMLFCLLAIAVAFMFRDVMGTFLGSFTA